jgi:hypothetical protein
MSRRVWRDLGVNWQVLTLFLIRWPALTLAKSITDPEVNFEVIVRVPVTFSISQLQLPVTKGVLVLICHSHGYLNSFGLINQYLFWQITWRYIEDATQKTWAIAACVVQKFELYISTKYTVNARCVDKRFENIRKVGELRGDICALA